jgi:glutaredoxin
MKEFLKKNLVYTLLIMSLLAFGVKMFFVDYSKYEVDETKVNLYFFYGDGCPHCAKEEEFLDKLEKKYDQIEIHRFETWYNAQNAALLDKVRGDLKFNTGVPVLIVGEESIVGYSSYEVTGKKIETIVNEYVKNGCNDVMLPYLGNSKDEVLAQENEKSCEHSCDKADECEHDCGCSADMSTEKSVTNSIHFPFFGDIKIDNLAMPLLTIVIAAADGFNPCAMWVLVFLISLLIDMQDRKRMWILGLAFIITSALVYYVFVFTWLQIFVSIGVIIWVRLAIGLLAIGSGAYHLKEYWENADGVCKVTGGEKRRAIFNRIKLAVKEKALILSLLGIIILALAVNLVELLCSAGFPQTFTQVLAMKQYSFWQNQAYLWLYITIFMLDDLFVFFIAMKTMQLKGISSKYSRWSSLIGGIIILLIGILLIFKPEWIMFG